VSDRRPAPDVSFPSLTTLLAKLPERDVAYTNDGLFEPQHFAALAQWHAADRQSETEPDDRARETHNPVAVAVAPTRARSTLGLLAAFVLGAMSLTAVNLARSDAPAPAVTLDAAGHTFDAWARTHDLAGESAARVALTTPSERTTKRTTKRRDRAASSAALALASTVSTSDRLPVSPRAARSETSNAAALLAAVLAPDAPPPAVAFDSGAASAVIAAAIGRARGCGDGSATGDARISVTFASSGRATAAVIDASSPLAGISVGSCVASAMQGLSVPPYEGESVTVRRWISIR
jgi:hypothetical protein